MERQIGEVFAPVRAQKREDPEFWDHVAKLDRMVQPAIVALVPNLKDSRAIAELWFFTDSPPIVALPLEAADGMVLAAALDRLQQERIPAQLKASHVVVRSTRAVASYAKIPELREHLEETDAVVRDLHNSQPHPLNGFGTVQMGTP